MLESRDKGLDREEVKQGTSTASKDIERSAYALKRIRI
jgi:hypothetical protein